MKWSTKTWHAIEPIYAAIQQMPFIETLRTGTLEIDKFQYYLKQDSLYLEVFSRVLSDISTRLTHPDDAELFMGFSKGAIAAEEGLHSAYFRTYGVNNRGVMLPACHHYTSFLKSSLLDENIEIAIAAVLPCFWIYKEIGDYIYANRISENNPFIDWIDTYAGDEFGESVRKAIDLCDRYAQNVSLETQNAMTEAFIYASQLEFDFWDAADRLRNWEVEMPND